jgi:prophage regulatory protein
MRPPGAQAAALLRRWRGRSNGSVLNNNKEQNMSAQYSPPEASAPRLIRLHEVKSRVGLGRSAIYAKMKQGDFPESVHLGARAVAWRSDEIDDWINARIVESRRPANDGGRDD